MVRPRLFVTGGQGRIGRILERVWTDSDGTPFEPIFLGRDQWDILTGQPPDLDEKDAVLDLAGKTRGSVAENSAIAARVADWASRAGAVHFLMSSASVYFGGPRPMYEDEQRAPVSDYGKSKAESEDAVRRINPKAIILRMGNVAGADALLGNLCAGIPARLDPVEHYPDGPVRSYIGPITLAKCLARLVTFSLEGTEIPEILNIAQPDPVSMGSLLRAAGHPWSFGPSRSGVISKVELSVDQLSRLMEIPAATPTQLVDEAAWIRGRA